MHGANLRPRHLHLLALLWVDTIVHYIARKDKSTGFEEWVASELLGPMRGVIFPFIQELQLNELE